MLAGRVRVIRAHGVIFNDAEPVVAARMSVHQRLDDVPDAEIYAGVFAVPLPAPTCPGRAQAPSRSSRWGGSGRTPISRMKSHMGKHPKRPPGLHAYFYPN